MKNERRFPGMAAVLVGSLSFAMSACATQPAGSSVAGLNVETSAASHYEITRVRVEQDAGVIDIRGDVSNTLPQRGFIPGQVTLRLVGPDGETLAEDSTKPMRRNRQARSAHFYTRLPVAPPDGSTLVITHRLG